MGYRSITAIGRRLQTDRRYRIVTTAALSLVVNLLYGAAHAAFGVLNRSPWLLVMAGYYILLGTMRFDAVRTERQRRSEQAVMRRCGGMLMGLALVIGAVSGVSLATDRAAPHGIVVMLTIATYTFCKMAMAIVHSVQARQSGTPLTRTIRNITLASALASLMTMQRSMLVSFESDMSAQTVLILNAITGGVVCLLVFLLGLNMLFDEKGFDLLADSGMVRGLRRAGRAIARGCAWLGRVTVAGYRKTEQAVTGAYRKIETGFVLRFLARDGETAEDCKARLKAEAEQRHRENARRTGLAQMEDNAADTADDK